MQRNGASLVRTNFPASPRLRRERLTRLFCPSILHALSLTLLCLLPAHAQVSATLSGIVTDPSGAPVPAAAVTAKNLETAAVRSTVTDDAGRYQVLSLAVGEYEVTVTKSGFQEEIRSGIHLVVGQEASVDFRLHVGEVQQRVTVTEEAPIVSTTTRDISGLVGEQQVKQLPLNGRSFDLLLTLNPGVVNFTWEKTGGVGISNSTVGNMFSVSGNRPQQNLFLLNGVEFTGAAENNMQPGGTSQLLLGVDAVREFNVLRDTYGAEYGKRPGAQVTIVTQSGTNDLHGSVFEFLRNSAFDARNFFDRASIPHFERNQFGVSLGGPIQKDKTFLFGNYEGFRQHLNLTDVTLVPDTNARNGFLPCALVKPAPKPCPASGLANVGLAPGVAALFSLWPVQSPNAPDFGGIAEAFNTPLQTIREDFGTVRLDRIFSSKDSFGAVYTVDDSNDLTPTSNPFSKDLETLREQVLSLEETHVLSPTFLNTARIGFSRASYFYTGEPTPNTLAANVPSFLAGRRVGAVVIGGSAASNPAAQLSLAGSNNGSNLTITRNLFTYEDNISITRGRHQVSIGAWSQWMQSNSGLALSQFGQATFTGLQTLLQGSIGTFLFDPAPTPLGWRSWFGALYAEDIIRLSPKLTLSLGFRHESSNGWTEVHERAATFVFVSGALATNPHIGKNVFTNNNAKVLPQPRIGLAWSPFGKSRTVVRAGFGMYNELQDALGYRLDQNAPFNPTFSIANLAVNKLPIVPGAPLPGKAKVVPGGVQPDLRTPTLISYSLRVEQELTPNLALTIGYVGSHGYHELVSIDANEPVPVCPAPPCTAATATYPLGPGGAKPPLANPALANTFSWYSEGNSSYNALLLDMNRRFSGGLSLRGVYTFSRTLDDGDSLNATAAANSPGLVMFPGNIRADWGLATYHVKNIGVMNGVYELPFGHRKRFASDLNGIRSTLASGWTLNSILTLQSGFPFTPQLSFNPSNNGDTRNPVRPSINLAFTGPVILGSPNGYFNPDAFLTPPDGTYGNLGRNTFIGPGLASWDLSLLKDTRIRERLSLQFRAEFFNFLNHANFNTPNLITLTPTGISPTAGVITSTSTASRQIQFGLKLLW
ncbi:MAG TPA: carboxypeptidase-like regulatory domain-containing protein [Candidatus Acidoferrum sp.]|nr:carboxypeptidase-like regulatory domain-containing protein [Candidatus Acidoferrum sp.]